MSEDEKKAVLILGATGYLGQFLAHALAQQYKVGLVHHSTAAPKVAGDVKPFWVDLVTGEGLQEAFDTLGPVSVVVNCAAISSPGACEKHPEQSRKVNVPSRLLDSLDIHKLDHERETLLIHFSTDHVYDGSKPNWKEDDECKPINHYGRAKRDAELLIQERWENHVILRSSVIIGPQASAPVSRTLFLQFIERTLVSGKPAKFFTDEFRSPVYVKDIVEVVRHFIESSDKQLPERLFNLGGPERLSRVAMARTVADVWNYSPAAIEETEVESVQREVPSPQDISLDSWKLTTTLPEIKFHSFSEALADIDPEEHNALLADSSR